MRRLGHPRQLASKFDPLGFLPIVDRYILRQLVGWHAASIGVIVLLLWLESVPRLLIEVSHVDQKANIVVRSLATLTPEYVAVAIPFAVYFCTATVFRRLALSSELDALAGCGVSSWRMLRQPLIIALVSCLSVLVIRGFVEPANERQLDEIGRSVKQGKFGFGLEPGVQQQLSRSTRLLFGQVGRPGNVLLNVVVDSDKFTALANSATLGYDRNYRWEIVLENGNIFWRDKGVERAFHFRRLSLADSSRAPVERPTSITDRLDRLDLRQLLNFGPGGAAIAHRAFAAASDRIDAALLCLFLPLFGFVQSIPPKRSGSAFAFGLGIVEILLFWRLSALVEDRFSPFAFLGHSLLLTVFIAAALFALRFQTRRGFGAIEQSLTDLIVRVRALCSPSNRRKSVEVYPFGR